jgi:hypothetical protein
MTRRELVRALGCGLATAVPFGVRAQQLKAMVGVVSPGSSTTTGLAETFSGA